MTFSKKKGIRIKRVRIKRHPPAHVFAASFWCIFSHNKRKNSKKENVFIVNSLHKKMIFSTFFQCMSLQLRAFNSISWQNEVGKTSFAQLNFFLMWNRVLIFHFHFFIRIFVSWVHWLRIVCPDSWNRHFIPIVCCGVSRTNRIPGFWLSVLIPINRNLVPIILCCRVSGICRVPSDCWSMYGYFIPITRHFVRMVYCRVFWVILWLGLPPVYENKVTLFGGAKAPTTKACRNAEIFCLSDEKVTNIFERYTNLLF